MIIGLTGAICAGKYELARYLMQTYGFEAVNLLDTFKLHLKELQEANTEEETKDDDFCFKYYQLEYR